jgi:hypothetical protein
MSEENDAKMMCVIFCVIVLRFLKKSIMTNKNPNPNPIPKRVILSSSRPNGTIAKVIFDLEDDPTAGW